MKFRYTLSHSRYGQQVVEDPIGWDELQVNLDRDMETHGVFNVFLELPTEFWGEGKKFLETCFESNFANEPRWSETVVNCLIELDEGEGWETVAEGVLAFDAAEMDHVTFSTNIEEVGTYRKLMAREKVKVDVDNTISIEGVSLSALESHEIHVLNKTVADNADYTFDHEVGGFVSEKSSGQPTLRIEVNTPLTEQVAVAGLELLGSNDINTLAAGAGYLEFIYNIDYQIEADFASGGIGADMDFSIDLYKNGSVEDVLFSYSVSHLAPYDAQSYPTSGNIRGRIIKPTVTAGTTWAIEMNLEAGGSILNFATLAIQGSLRIGVATDFPTTILKKGYLLRDVAKGILRQILDNTDPLVTDHFDYDNAERPFAEQAIINGFQLRDVLNQPPRFTWRKWYESVKAIFAVGYSINNAGQIVLEPISYFYTNEVLLDFTYIDYKKKINPDLLFTNIKAGFKDYYAEEAESSNDAVHAEREYATLITSVSNELELMSDDLVADPFMIEFQRRLQAELATNRSGKYDKDNFIINVQKVVEGGVVYWQTRQVTPNGWVGVFFPDDMYNGMLTPVNMLERWRTWWESSMRGAQLLRLTSGEGNYIGVTSFWEFDTVETEFAEEEGLAQNPVSPILYPFIYEAEVPFDHRLFQVFKTPENRKKLIGVGRGAVAEVYGYIKKLEYTPGKRTANLTLLAKGEPLTRGIVES